MKPPEKKLGQKIVDRVKKVLPVMTKNDHKEEMTKERLGFEQWKMNFRKYYEGRGDSNFNDVIDPRNAFDNTYLRELDVTNNLLENYYRSQHEEMKKKSLVVRVKEFISRFSRALLGQFGQYAIPLDLSIEQINAQREAAWTRYFLDPVAGNVVDALMHYAIGQGLIINAQVQEVDDYLEKILRDYKYENQQKWDFRRLNVDGALGFFITDNAENKMMKIAQLKAINVEEMLFYKNNPVYYKISAEYFGSDDIDDSKWYKDVRFEDFEGGEFPHDKVPDDVESDGSVFYIRYGDGKYGEPWLTRSLRWFQIHEEFYKDVSRTMHEISRILIKKKIYSPQDQAMTDTDVIRDAPPGGYEIIEWPGHIEYDVMQSKVDGQGFKDIDRILRSSVCAGTSTPEHIAFQDASNNNYASVLEAKNPYVVFVGFRQDWYIQAKLEFLRVLLKLGRENQYIGETFPSRKYELESMKNASVYILQSVASGKFDNATIMENAKVLLGEAEEKMIPVEETIINIVAPKLKVDDPLKDAQALAIHNELGIPPEMIWPQLGYNPKDVFDKLLASAEKEKEDAKRNEIEFNRGRSNEPPDYLKEKDE